MQDKLFISCSQTSVLDIGLNVATDNAEGGRLCLSLSISNSFHMYNNHNCGVVMRSKTDIFKIFLVLHIDQVPINA